MHTRMLSKLYAAVVLKGEFRIESPKLAETKVLVTPQTMSTKVRH